MNTHWPTMQCTKKLTAAKKTSKMYLEEDHRKQNHFAFTEINECYSKVTDWLTSLSSCLLHYMAKSMWTRHLCDPVLILGDKGQFVPKLLGGVQVRARCRSIKFFHSKLGNIKFFLQWNKGVWSKPWNRVRENSMRTACEQECPLTFGQVIYHIMPA